MHVNLDGFLELLRSQDPIWLMAAAMLALALANLVLALALWKHSRRGVLR